jgi:hypothetical protein
MLTDIADGGRCHKYPDLDTIITASGLDNRPVYIQTGVQFEVARPN